jgi:ABC-type antimicrobial peptide transport system permease subunit
MLLVLSVTVIAGLYPAWLISGFKLLPTLKNTVNTISVGGISLRRSLVTLQFVISQLLIIGTIVIISQMNYLQSTSLGFDKEAIISVPLPDNKPGTLASLRTRLLENTHVQQVSFAFNHPLSDYGFNVNFKYKDSGSEQKYPVELKFAGGHYLETYRLKLLAGENLSVHDSVHSFIVNEAVVNKMGLSNPQDAIGKMIVLTPGDETPQLITGVIQNFHSKSLHQSIAPCILMKNHSFLNIAGVRVHPQHIRESLKHIEKTWSAVYPENLFEYQFLDEAIAGYYKKEKQTAQILQIFTTIAIFSGCLGIYGLLFFMAARRIKEISIRKIVGASAWDIMHLLSKELLCLC